MNGLFNTLLRKLRPPEGPHLRYLSRFSLLVLLPFLLGLWVLPHTQYLDGQSVLTPELNVTEPGPSLTYFFVDNRSDNQGPERVNALFPLADYADFPPLVTRGHLQMCFADTGSQFVLRNGTAYPAYLVWNVQLDDGQRLAVHPGLANCTDVSLSHASHRWSADPTPALVRLGLNGSVVFDPNTRAWPRIQADWGLLQGLVFIPVFYLLVWYPAAGIWRKIKDGMEAQ